MTFVTKNVLAVVLAVLVTWMGGMAAAAEAPAPVAAAAAPAPTIGSTGAAPSVGSTEAAAQPVVKLPEGVVALVNGEPVTEKEWADTVKRVYGPSVLTIMINHKLVRQAASRRGIALTDAEVQTDFDKNVAQAGGLDAFVQALNENGETLQDRKETLKTELLLKKLVEGSVTASDEDLKNTYLEQYGPRAEVQVIVVGTQPEADQVITETKTGDFSEIATRRSTDVETARNHGYLPMPLSKGFFPKPYGNVVITATMADAIFALKPGGISGAMQAPAKDAFYVFKLVNVEPARDVKFEMVKDQVKADFVEVESRSKAEQYMKQLVEGADIRTGLGQ